MLGASLDLASYLDRLNREVARLSQDDIHHWADLIFDAWKNGRFVFIIGNGGSGTTASHMAEDLGKSTLRPEDLKDEGTGIQAQPAAAKEPPAGKEAPAAKAAPAKEDKPRSEGGKGGGSGRRRNRNRGNRAKQDKPKETP